MDRRPPPVPPSPPEAQQPAPVEPPPPPQQGPWVPVPDPATDFVRDEGVAEAAPPPFDVPEPVKPPYLHDQGVAEAAPPPYLHDQGVAEAAPPPYDRYRSAPSVARYDVRTTPALPLAFRGRPVSGPMRLAVGDPPLFLGDATTPIRATVRILPRGPEATVRVESAQPLSVTFEGKGGSTPWSASLPRREGSPVTLLLSDEATAARVVVRLTLLP
jgi:hypothetical protein